MLPRAFARRGAIHGLTGCYLIAPRPALVLSTIDDWSVKMLSRETLELYQRYLVGELRKWESPERIAILSAQLTEVAHAINASAG